MCSKEEIVIMANQLFSDYDANNNGYLERQEVKKIIDTIFNEVSKTHPMDQKKSNKMFTTFDENSGNKLSKEEFQKFLELFLEPVYL